ncbi:MAG: TraK family protein [Nitrospira sp.]|nr:TraK family protein [Nitrospira sp.]
MGVKKSLSVRVQERAQRVLPGARNRAQVVALRKEIEQALQDGCSLAMIWHTLQEEQAITCSYETFRAHVRKLTQPHLETHPAPSATTDRSTHKSKPMKPAPRPADTSGFIFNPVPNEEELY